MCTPHARSAVLVVAALMMLALPGRTAAQAPVAPTDGRLGSIRGIARDSSAAVLPGVAVVAIVDGGRTLGSTFTNASGEFSFDGLPAGPIALRFHLDGFVDATTRATVHSSGPAGPAHALIEQRLELAALAESVVVRADPPPPPPPPPPVLVPVPAHDEASVCGPAKVDWSVPSQGTIVSHRKGSTQGLFAAGDEIIVNGGTANGMSVGQNFVVRRHYRTDWPIKPGVFVIAEHSSGVLQIVAVEEQVSTAVVVYACDAMMTGDYLAPFQPEPIRAPDAYGSPVFDKAARIMFADAGQMVGVTNRMMVISHGSEQGIRPGQRLTLFRRSRFGNGKPAVVGEAVVVAARTDSSTIRVEQAADAIFFGDGGDWAAPQQPAQVGRR